MPSSPQVLDEFVLIRRAIQHLHPIGVCLGEVVEAVGPRKGEGFLDADAGKLPWELDWPEKGWQSNLARALAHVANEQPFVSGRWFKPSPEEPLDLDASMFVQAGPQKWVSVGKFTGLDLELLQKHAQPSSFGDLKTNKTTYDESVRIAMEIKADQLAIRFAEQTKRESE